MRFEASISNTNFVSVTTVSDNNLKALIAKLKYDIQDKNCRVNIYDNENGGYCMRNSMIGVAS